MKFRADRTEFADAVLWSLRTVGARASLPALSGVLLEVRGDQLLLRSFDNEMASERWIPVAAEREGTALVPGRLLGDVVRNLPAAAVDAEVDGDRLHVTCKRAKFHLRLMPADDFPPLPEPAPDAPAADLDAAELSRTVAQVARAASAEDARPVLTGVSLEARPDSLTAVATDSYRLAMRTVPWDQPAETTALVPRRALLEAQRAADAIGGSVRLVLEDAQATFAFGDRRLTTRLVEGRYPDVRQLLPGDSERVLVVDRAQLTEVVKRIAVVGVDAANTNTPVTLQLQADTVRVTAGSGETGQAEESLPAELEGEDLTISFNPRYLTEGLDATGSTRVRIELRDDVKPAVLRPIPEEAGDDDATTETLDDAAPAAGDGVDFLYLLMPMRL
jgi:DNA polymerase-3 subunit beta